jgi:hypothetical protein
MSAHELDETWRRQDNFAHIYAPIDIFISISYGYDARNEKEGPGARE